jgi:glycosyltransferase involved in cell wall biosynthesis
MMKDEADVCRQVVSHLAEQGVDTVIVADNRSSDGTADLLRSLACPAEVVVLDDPEPAYYQSAKMTALARRAHSDHGADWIIPFDADELWVATDGIQLRHFLMEQHDRPGVSWVTATILNHFPTGVDDPTDRDPFRRLRWRLAEPNPLPKWAFRWNDAAVIAQGNHAVTGLPGHGKGGLSIHHYPCRSFAHFKRKVENGAAAYAATDLPESEGAHWRGYGRILAEGGEAALRGVYEEHFWFLDPEAAGLVLDPAPSSTSL